MSGDYDPRMRFRVYVDASVVEEVWIDVLEPDTEARVDEIRNRHKAITDTADANGQVWLVEVYDPSVPTECAYQRFGTDTAGMVQPIQKVGRDD